MERDQKEQEYREYLKNHIDNVQEAWKQLQLKFPDQIFVQNQELNQQISYSIQHHDESKYSVEEFEPYRAFFYPVSSYEKKEVRPLFFNAFKHHYQVNEHHWEHWIDSNGSPIDRGEKRIQTLVEMMCDWIAMSMKFGNTAEEYFNTNSTKIKLLPNDHQYVSHILHLFYQNNN